MKLAVLFWFYKDIDVCVNRLRLLRKYNGGVKIFGLYGGALETAIDFREALAPYLDDFYSYDGEQDPSWKWRNGDLMITHWYSERGTYLEWDTVTIIQADMVVLGSIPGIFKELKKDEILLSSLRAVDDVSSWWYWISEHQGLYNDFYQYLVAEHGYSHAPFCCQFVVVCLPKVFLEKYSKVGKPEKGFIEYRVPMYAQLFGVPFSKIEAFDCWWDDDPGMKAMPIAKRTLIADKMQIPLWVVLSNATLYNKKIFHPFNYIFPFTFASSIKFVKQVIDYKLMNRVTSHFNRMKFIGEKSSN